MAFKDDYSVDGQLSIFDCFDFENKNGGDVLQRVTINKKIRLIELFAG